MPIYYDRKNMLIFTVHHLVATIAFYLILHYRVGLFFGIYRLTTELSTPFTNQRLIDSQNSQQKFAVFLTTGSYHNDRHYSKMLYGNNPQF
ncbi:unnamed protein product [Hymenolepis diminuta]|uniref:TLC domain-containing protein n=1 Tax=Hymenolepis diminuta TaxID=6216 RepID=A0A564ZE83_HYMDI|nr:unnamed protein product [Hymenolepis diminuta]